MNDYCLCIHGHFYQPPRENPWLEAIELQDSAYPYHDWNERITAECYAPNATSRILDKKGRIVQMVNNYSKISFDFGPTLLSWLQKEARDVYNAILEADEKSREHFSGHGSALAQEVFGDSIKPRFLQLLGQAKSNLPEHRDGRRIFETFTQPDMLDLGKVGAHYAVSSLFSNFSKQDSLFCYTVEQEDYRSFGTEEPRVVVGRIQVTSEITRESSRLCFAVFHAGAEHLHCGVRKFRDEEAYQSVLQSVSRTFDRGDFHELRKKVEQHFEASLYSLTSVFRDEQRRIVDVILEASVKDTEASFRELYERHAPVMRFLKGAGIRAPRVLFVAAEVALNAALRQAFESEEPDPERIATFLKEASMEGITLDDSTLEFTLRKTLVLMAERFASNPGDLILLKTLEAGTEIVKGLPFPVNLWKVQNICYEVCKTVCPGLRDSAEQGDKEAMEWISVFRELCGNLKVSILQPANLHGPATIGMVIFPYATEE